MQPVKVVKFENVGDLLRVAQSPTSMPDAMRTSIRGTEKFTGTRTLQDAIDLARRGWDGGIRQIEAFKAEIEKLTRGLVPVPQPEPHMSRGRVSVSRAISGQPKAFIRRVDHGRTRNAMMPKIVNLVYNASVSGSIGSDVVLRRGAAMIVACQTLERRNIRCGIEIVFATTPSARAARWPDQHPDGPSIEYRLRIKHHNEHVSVDKLAFFMGHTATLRRLLFALLEHNDDATRKQFRIGRDNGNYGYPAETDDRGHIYIGRIVSPTDWGSDFTMTWIKKTLKDQGLNIREDKPAPTGQEV
jgi:hypothetical protein